MPRYKELRPGPSDNESLVRFTLISWVRWYSHKTEKGGTEHLARSVDLSKSAFNRWLHDGLLDADNLVRLRKVCEQIGDQGPLDRWYATHDDFRIRYRPQADPRWWRELGSNDRFRGPVDVLVAADAAIARFRPSETGSPPPAQRDRDSINRIALALCRVQSGPFDYLAIDGAYTRLATLLPWCLEVVEAYCTEEVTGFIVARTVDRGLRLYPQDQAIAACAHRLVARFAAASTPTTPPTTIPLRLARRLARKSPKEYGRSVLDYLEHVSRTDSDPCARRAAVWYIYELAPEIDLGRPDQLRVATRGDPELAMLTRWLDDNLPHAFNVGNRDGVAMAGRVTDSRANEATLRDLIGSGDNPARAGRLPSQLRAPVTELLLDVVTSPCPVRVRTIANALASASPDVLDHATDRLCAVLDTFGDSAPDDGSVHLAARAASRAGVMRHSAGAALPHLVRALDSPSPAVTAIAAQTTGDILHAAPNHPRAEDARKKLRRLADHRDATVCQAAAHSLAITSDPRLAHFDKPAPSPTNEAIVPWVRWGLWLQRRDIL